MLLAPKRASGTWHNGRLLPMPTMPGQKPEAVEVKDGDWIAFADPTKVSACTMQESSPLCPAGACDEAVLPASLALIAVIPNDTRPRARILRDHPPGLLFRGEAACRALLKPLFSPWQQPTREPGTNAAKLFVQRLSSETLKPESP